MGARYLERSNLPGEAWSNTPSGPANDLATSICNKGLAAYELPWTILNLIHDVAYLIARTWTQDFDRLTPGWLPKQNSPWVKLLEAISGHTLIPSLESIGLKDLDSISHFMPPYGRPTILSVSLIKDFYRYGLNERVKQALGELIDCLLPDGSWCEDVVVTSLGIMALYLCGYKKDLRKSCEWLCSTQYEHGGWPSFNQLTNWAVGWSAVILGSQEPAIHRKTTPFLLNATYQDGSVGTAPPFSYPDLDDTAIALLGLASDRDLDPAKYAGTRDLLLKLQNWDGSWSTFPSFSGEPPACGCHFPIYIKSEDVTVHVMQALLKVGLPKSSSAITKSKEWLIKRQHANGTWNSTWFLGQTYATAQVTDLLYELQPQSEAVRKGIGYLLHAQKDGHWDTGSAGETGLAVYTLLRTGTPPEDQHIQSALRYLQTLQQPDGSFRPAYSGFYASGLYYEEPLSEALAVIRALILYHALGKS